MKYINEILLSIIIALCLIILISDIVRAEDKITNGDYQPLAVTGWHKLHRPFIMFSDKGKPLSVIKNKPKAEGDYVYLYEAQDIGDEGESDALWERMCIEFCQYDVNGKLKGIKK